MPYKDPKRQRAAQRKWYVEKQQSSVAERSKRARVARMEWLNATKEGVPCAECGVDFSSCAKDWHHRDPEQKLFCVGDGMKRYSKARIMAEIAKCELLCANCHRIRTHIGVGCEG